MAAAPQAISPAPERHQELAPQELDQLVAPIALYPDALIAQILAVSTFPTEIVEAERWMQAHPNLTGDALAQEVDKQPWDASVKALTEFPAVLANMDKNLSWTSALGDAYTTQPQEVLDTIQVMRQRAQQAGNLKSTPQEIVTTEGQTVTIQPANAEVVYVPEYDPWLAYGAPLVEYPGWVPVSDLFLTGPGFAWSIGFGVFAGFGWGWDHWGADWHHRGLEFDHHAYISRSRTFSDRAGRFRAGADFGHLGGFRDRFAASHDRLGIRSGAFSGFDHGAMARTYSFRGASSLGGFHGGFAGGFHGGGFHGGGGGHR